jgi:phospholipid/cholesterol/gamma-HCH transport system substrate-binding protein
VTDLDRQERRLQLWVGGFVFLGLLAALVVIVLLGRQRHVFESRARLHAAFRDVSGLRPGAPVWLSGVSVGTVTRIAVGQPGENVVKVDLEISRKMLSRVRTDSVASIASQGLLGDKIVQISMGSAQAPEVPSDGTLKTSAPADFNKIVEQASAILEQVQQVALKAADAMRDLARPETIADLRRVAGSLRALLGQAESGPGVVHSLFYDRKTAEHLHHIASDLDHMVARVDDGVAQLQKVLDSTDEDGRQVINNLSRAAKGVGGLAGSVPQRQVARALSNLELATSDLAQLTRHVREGHGTIGALVMDPTVYDQLVTVLGGVQRSRVLRALVRWAITKGEKGEAKDVRIVQPGTPKGRNEAKR